MADFRAADHAMGLELQIEELIEQRERANVQGFTDEAERVGREIEALQAELAATAERAATEDPQPALTPELHDADKLEIDQVPD